MQNFFAALFDLSFKKFITPQLAGAIYIMGIVVSAISALFMIRTPVAIVPTVMFFLASIVSLRVGMEMALSIIQTARYSAEIARRGRANNLEESSNPFKDSNLEA